MITQLAADCAAQARQPEWIGLVAFAFAMGFIMLPIGVVEAELAIRRKLIKRGWNIRPI